MALGFFSDSTPSFEYAGSNRKDDSSDKLDESALLLMLRKLDSPISLAGTVDAILIDGGKRYLLKGGGGRVDAGVWIREIKDF